MKSGQKATRKYRKSPEQLAKERERRRKLQEAVLSHPKPWTLTQVKVASKLSCSQATVSRDLTKLASSRWNPFRLLESKMEELREMEEKRRFEFEQRFTYFSMKERFKLLTKLFLKRSGGHRYPENSNPRGKPFSKDYQPRWGRWGSWPFSCQSCGFKGEIEFSGD